MTPYRIGFFFEWKFRGHRIEAWELKYLIKTPSQSTETDFQIRSRENFQVRGPEFLVVNRPPPHGFHLGQAERMAPVCKCVAQEDLLQSYPLPPGNEKLT